MVKNDLSTPLAKFCLRLESDRRTEQGRILSAAEFRQYFFGYDSSSAYDRVMKLLPPEVRGPILASWGIRGRKTAMRDDDERVCAAVHDAFLAGDIDDELFEQGIRAEMVIGWAEFPDWWTFWRSGRHTPHSLALAFEAASELGLLDASWFFEAMESTDGTLRGTDVLTSAMTPAELGAWIKRVHQSGDGSPNGLLEAIGWPVVIDRTPVSFLLLILDRFAPKLGVARLQSLPVHVPEAEAPGEYLPDDSMESVDELTAAPLEETAPPISTFRWIADVRKKEDDAHPSSHLALRVAGSERRPSSRRSTPSS
jgi:hypothetical protein